MWRSVGSSRKERLEGLLEVWLYIAVFVEWDSIVEEDKVGQAAVVAVAQVAGEGVVVGSIEDLSGLIVKRRLVVTEEVSLVDYVEVEEVFL